MAPIPPSNTFRVYLDYTSQGIAHTQEWRLSGTPSEATMATFAANAAAANRVAMLSSDTITGARYSPEGEDFTLPLLFTPQAGNLTPGFVAVWAEDPEAAMVSLVGRGTAVARRWRVTLFTPYAFANSSVNWPSDNRYTLGENAAVDTLYDLWTTLLDATHGTSRVVTIGGDTIRPKGYINISKNAYWQRRQRG